MMCCWTCDRDRGSFLAHCAVELDEDNRDAVFIPPGMAHGFQTLSRRRRGALPDERFPCP